MRRNLNLIPLVSILVLSINAQTFPTTPVYTNVGNLHCGLRLVTAQRVQTWCYEGVGTGNLPHNTISTINPGRIIVDGYTSGADQILWVISQVGQPEIRYSITTSTTNGSNSGILAMGIDLQNRIFFREITGRLNYELPSEFVWAGIGSLEFLIPSP